MRELEEKYLCIHYINIRQTSGFWCFLLGELCGEVNDGGGKKMVGIIYFYKPICEDQDTLEKLTHLHTSTHSIVPVSKIIYVCTNI